MRKINSTNVAEVVQEIAKKEPLITSSRIDQVTQLVQRKLWTFFINTDLLKFAIKSSIQTKRTAAENRPTGRSIFLFV